MELARGDVTECAALLVAKFSSANGNGCVSGARVQVGLGHVGRDIDLQCHHAGLLGNHAGKVDLSRKGCAVNRSTLRTMALTGPRTRLPCRNTLRPDLDSVTARNVSLSTHAPIWRLGG